MMIEAKARCHRLFLTFYDVVKEGKIKDTHLPTFVHAETDTHHIWGPLFEAFIVGFETAEKLYRRDV